ncbi:MAG: hypothetical protein QNK03_26115 [Myxococcota bacterium]|nr:hypothetical protein [Myxococcota bacterium]
MPPKTRFARDVASPVACSGSLPGEPLRLFVPVLAVTFFALFAAPPAPSEVFVATNEGVLVFSAPGTHSEDEPGGWQDGPIRRLGGPTAGFTAANAVAVDTENEELFVLPGDLEAAGDSEAAILVFGAQDEGDVPPRRAIRGPTTQLEPRLGASWAIAVDTERDEIVLASGGLAPILVFDRQADGDAAPIRRIEYGASGLLAVDSIFIDAGRDEIFLGDTTGSVFVFDRDAEGNVPPKRVIEITETEGIFPVQSIFLDDTTGELFVTRHEVVLVFDALSDGFVQPLRRLFPWPESAPGPLVLSDDDLLIVAISSWLFAFPKEAEGQRVPSRDSAYLGFATYARGVTSSHALGGASSFFLPEPAAAVAGPVVLLALVAMRRAGVAPRPATRAGRTRTRRTTSASRP